MQSDSFHGLQALRQRVLVEDRVEKNCSIRTPERKGPGAGARHKLQDQVLWHTQRLTDVYATNLSNKSPWQWRLNITTFILSNYTKRPTWAVSWRYNRNNHLFFKYTLSSGFQASSWSAVLRVVFFMTQMFVFQCLLYLIFVESEYVLSTFLYCI